MIRLTCPRAGALSLRRAAPALVFLAALACNERASDLREWRVSDHDHTENPSNGQVQVDPSDAGAPAVPGLEDVTIVAWQQNCTQCHGQLGRGDGPRGPMLRATNLSDPTWQAAVSDEHIARSIKEGKGAMPAFKLPDGTITNLVKLVRMMNAARVGPPGASSATAAPTAAAPTSRPSASAPVLKPSAASAAARPSSTAPLPKPSAP